MKLTSSPARYDDEFSGQIRRRWWVFRPDPITLTSSPARSDDVDEFSGLIRRCWRVLRPDPTMLTISNDQDDVCEKLTMMTGKSLVIVISLFNFSVISQKSVSGKENKFIKPYKYLSMKNIMLMCYRFWYMLLIFPLLSILCWIFLSILFLDSMFIFLLVVKLEMVLFVTLLGLCVFGFRWMLRTIWFVTNQKRFHLLSLLIAWRAHQLHGAPQSAMALWWWCLLLLLLGRWFSWIHSQRRLWWLLQNVCFLIALEAFILQMK